MENQHRKITGYRELSTDEIDAMNEIKGLAAEVGAMIETLHAPALEADMRWLAIGRTELQQGFMALVRAIAKPTTF